MFGRKELKTNFWTSINGFFYEKTEADKVMDAMETYIQRLEDRANELELLLEGKRNDILQEKYKLELLELCPKFKDRLKIKILSFFGLHI